MNAVRTTLVLRLAVWRFDRFVPIAETIIGATLGKFVTTWMPPQVPFVPDPELVIETRVGRFRISVEGIEESIS